MCKYRPDSIEACKTRLGRLVLGFNLLKMVLTMVPVILLAYAYV